MTVIQWDVSMTDRIRGQDSPRNTRVKTSEREVHM